MKKATRRSSIVAAEDIKEIGNFSTRFSLPSFIKRVEKLSQDQRHAIKNTGFGNLLLMRNQMISKNLLVELMERWSCERHAFMLLPGVISFSLMDVALILGLRVIGDPILLEDEPFSDLEKEYGAVFWKRKITLASLETRLDTIGGAVNDDFIRTFLLFTVGTILFPTADGKVDSRYLSFLKNLDNVHQYAWGAAVLDYLIMWLNKRKEMKLQYVGGCLIFLQIWSYEHVDIARPSSLDIYLTFPRVCRWENNKSNQRQWFTTKFKELQHHQITWKIQPTPEELKIDVIKELLEAQSDRKELLGSQSPLTSGSIVEVVGEGTESDMDIANEVDGIQEVNLGQQMELQNVAEVQTNTMEYPSKSCYLSELHEEHVDLASQIQDDDINFTNDNDNDLRTRNRILEEQNMELREEIEKLRSENRLLRNQLLPNPLLEEQKVELKKEVDTLRRENQILSLSTNNLVVRIERLLLDEDINAAEET